MADQSGAIPSSESTANGGSVDGPKILLPQKVPQNAWRPIQSNIPSERTTRDLLKERARQFVHDERVAPPVPKAELLEHAVRILGDMSLDPNFGDYLAVLLSNESWRDTLARIPFDRRLLLLPKCLRVEEHCPAPFDEFGLLCKECGLCSIEEFTVEAERLGYAVLVAEGSAIVRQMIETGRIEAVVGVSCLNVLEKSFPHMEAAAVPGIAIPLLQDDCINCNVDLDHVWDVIHLTSDDKAWRLDLDALRARIDEWFTPVALEKTMGASNDPAARLGREWMARAGKRWRPFLATCTWLAEQFDGSAEEPPITPAMIQLAVAIECFHKASLVHDDIEDGDLKRYDDATLHAEHGEAVAINVGDWLIGEGYRLISELDLPAEARVEMLRIAAQGHVTLSRGQGLELDWANDPRPLSSMDVLEIFREKTAPAFEVALHLGAIAAGADVEVLNVLEKYSESIGVAYQIRDDLDDFNGSVDSHDLEGMRPSLLLAIASKKAETDEEREWIDALWHRRDTDVTRHRIIELLHERGVIQKAGELMEAWEEQAIRSLRFLENATLKGLLRRVVGKIFPRALIEGYCSEFEARNAPGGEARTSPAR